MPEYDREEQILHGVAVERFIKDPIILRVKAGLELDYFDEWKKAPNPEAAEEVRAKSRVLDDLWQAFERVVASGQRAKHEIEQLAKPQI